MILTRKIQLIPVGDKKEISRVYKYLRNGIYNQNKAKNQYITDLFIEDLKKASKEDRKELHRLYSRISSSKKGSAYDTSIEFAKGITLGTFKTEIENRYKKSVKDGVLSGKVSLPSYKLNNPLLVHSDYVRLRSTNPQRDCGMYHNYESHMDFSDHLYSKDLEIFIKFANDITFKMLFGNPRKSAYIRSELLQVFEENYGIGCSSIQLKEGRDGKTRIILNLTMDIPDEKLERDENIAVGVDLGQAIPAVCALNNNQYKREYWGSKDDFLRVRTQMQEQRRRLQKSLNLTSGGHGRKKKLKPLERFSERERNFVKTYNHKISKKVVDFAIQNNAKYINLEHLKGIDTSKFILRNWSYFELQQFITYKASKYGIEVRKINPAYTSQTCSVCGNLEDGQRIDQAHFKCKACGAELNADFNAARNIAMSTKFIKEEDEEDED